MAFLQDKKKIFTHGRKQVSAVFLSDLKVQILKIMTLKNCLKSRQIKRLYLFIVDTFGEKKTDIKTICEIYETMMCFPKTWSE